MSSSKFYLFSCILVICLFLVVPELFPNHSNLDSLSILRHNGTSWKENGQYTWREENNSEVMFHAAVLVAGSRGYGNYRHQADMCHAFQILLRNGMSSENIITFIYDDIAYNSWNQYPGEIYNQPGGENVYPGCAKDYTGKAVNRRILFAVLTGNHRAVRHIGSGRVLVPNPKQRIFFAYSDHGMPGFLELPNGRPLFADEFNNVIMELKKKAGFHQMLLYIEACYAGSMFKGLEIDKSPDVLVVTASEASESSYATYCPVRSDGEYAPGVTPSYLGVCMGDLFTVAWLEDTEKYGTTSRSIKDQIKAVTKRTSVCDTYNKGSHVRQFGDTRGQVGLQYLSSFMAGPTTTRLRFLWQNFLYLLFGEPVENYSQQEADLLSLRYQAARNRNTAASEQLEEYLRMREKTDGAIYSSIESLIGMGELSSNTSVSRFAEELIPTGPLDPVVYDWDCLRKMVEVWEEKCGPLNPYSGQYSRTFINLCNSVVPPDSFKTVLSC